MKDYSIHTIINNFFNIYHKNLTVLDISIKDLEEQYKIEHANAKFQIEVLTVYSIEEILKNLGYKKEEILKNVDNDTWLQIIERKHHLEKQSLINPSKYYLFIEDSEKYHNDPNWKDYYNALKNEFKKEKDATNIEP